MSDQYKGAEELPELPATYEEELELDSDLEPDTDDLQQLWQPIYEANLRSIERVYARLQSIERTRPPVSPAAPAIRQPNSSPASTPKGVPPMNTINTIKTTVPAPNETLSSPRRSRSFSPSRLTTIAAVLATGLLLTGTLLGFLYFHGGRPAQLGPTPQLRAKRQCQGAPFIDADQLNANGYYNSTGGYDEVNTYIRTPLDWSTPDAIAYSEPATLVWNPQTCRTTPSQSPIQVAMNSKTIGEFGAQVVFSPDGKRVLLVGGSPNWILDAQTGSILTKLQTNNAAITFGYGQAVWTDGGSQIVAVVTSATFNQQARQYKYTYKVQEWDSRTGALIRTAVTLHATVTFPFAEGMPGQVWISPDATHVAMLLADHSLQFWNIATGQLISTTPSIGTSSSGPATVAWSPDGQYFAYGINSANPSLTPGQTQIWSSQSGQLVITLPDTDTFKGIISSLSWSPNGQYLAESSGQITIWNTSTWQKAAVFGTVATSSKLGHGITQYELVETLAWSPDSSELASMTHSFPHPLTQIPVANDVLRLSVWKLAPVSAPTVQPAPPTSTPTPTPIPGSPVPVPTVACTGCSVVVPNMVGLTCFAATQALQQVGLQANCIAEMDPTDPNYPAGEAFSTDPPAGTQVAVNTEIIVDISQPAPTPTPVG